MKIILLYKDYLNEYQKQCIRKEWEDNEVVVLDGDPELHVLGDEEYYIPLIERIIGE